MEHIESKERLHLTDDSLRHLIRVSTFKIEDDFAALSCAVTYSQE